MEERIIKRMDEMGAALQNLYQNSNSEEGSSKNKGPKGFFGHSETGTAAPKLAKLNFPWYDGSEDPSSWVCKAEQFFDFQNTEEEDKERLAAYHLESEA
jgi:hypothetical protein